MRQSLLRVPRCIGINRRPLLRARLGRRGSCAKGAAGLRHAAALLHLPHSTTPPASLHYSTCLTPRRNRGNPGPRPAHAAVLTAQPESVGPRGPDGSAKCRAGPPQWRSRSRAAWLGRRPPPRPSDSQPELAARALPQVRCFPRLSAGRPAPAPRRGRWSTAVAASRLQRTRAWIALPATVTTRRRGLARRPSSKPGSSPSRRRGPELDPGRCTPPLPGSSEPLRPGGSQRN